MKINDLRMNLDNVFTDIQCKITNKIIVSKDGKVEMIGDNHFQIITKDNVIKFSIINENKKKLIMNYFNRHFFCLANITNHHKDSNTIFLHMSFFYNLKILGKIPIIINDAIKDKINNNYVKGKQNIEHFLEKNFTLTDGISKYFAYTTENTYINKDNEEKNILETKENNNLEIIDKLSHNKKDCFVIYGKEFNMYASIIEEEFNYRLFLEKISKNPQNMPMLRIAKATLEFSDYNTIVSKKVKEILDSNKGYLDLWNQYAEQEGILILQKVRNVGLINVNLESVTVDANGIHLPYSGLTKEIEELITNDSFLLFSDEIPIYLNDTDMTWNDYSNYLKELENIKYDINNKKQQIKVINKKNGGFILECSYENLPNSKYVSLSMVGDEKQILRREDARNRIAEGKSANPALGLIFEGQLSEEFTYNSSRKKIEPLSSFVKDKIFKNEPTKTQKRAIDIALNTPDIAIIQGPPGTGKTTVITAIIERLNEICNKQDKISGQILITSFQHDAVRNVIERLRINSLPTIKFGKQYISGEDDLSTERVIEEWCEEYTNKLTEKNPELIEEEQVKELSKLHNIYLAYPNDNNALEFLYCAKKINTDLEWDKKIGILIDSKLINDNKKNDNLLRYIRRLRTTKQGFIDDGVNNAVDLLDELENIHMNKDIPENKKIFEILNRAVMSYKTEPDENLLKDLANTKDYLLKKCISKPTYKREVPDVSITEIYKHLNQIIKKNKDEQSAILSDLLRELRLNRTEVEKSLQHYLFVYSATTQQSEGKEIKQAKGIKGEKKHPEYETVIVDEAARVSPSDLMVPLAQAKNRIILVGDHRQLPHIYDEEVFETLRQNGEDFDINNIKKSMFEYLLEKAKELEKIDNIQRTIVLDAQYRMHPILGEFINEIFYKPYDEYFGSPLPAENYRQFISKKNFPIEWYNFPNKYGFEEKIGTSRIRECETDFIVSKVSEYINSENGKNLSYGVITFYSEQVKNIKRKLKNILGEDSKKVRVGSVDAFQGMEFDVIFLSVVRSNNKEPVVRSGKGNQVEKIDFNILETDMKTLNKNEELYEKWKLYKEKVGMQNFGFLISENRLCVSLSRQKKLLIVVGDVDMFSKGEWGRLAEICVPGMRKLYELCAREDVIYDGRSESN